MKERELMLLALLVTMMLPMNMFAQKDDFGMWFTVGAEKKINTKWSVGVEAEYRTRNKVKTPERWSFGVDGSYKITPWLKASAGYVLLNDYNEKNTYYDDPEEDYDVDYDENGNEILIPYGYTGKVKKASKYWGLRHRVNLSLTGTLKLGRFDISLRERWQYTYRPEKTVSSRTKYTYLTDGTLSGTSEDNEQKTYKGKGKSVLRSRLAVGYDIPNCKVDPHASAEAYNSWSIEKIRYIVGADWKLNKKHVFTLDYRYQYLRNDEPNGDPNIHIIALGYKYKF